MRNIMIAVVAGCFMLVAGCGEKTQVIVYKQGQYQGKPDTQPWDNAKFNNDKAAWDKAVSARTRGQNEYVRIGN